MEKKKQKIWGFVICFAVVAAAFTAGIGLMQESSANPQIQLVIDKKNITTDVAPMVKNDRMLVPIRVISEELGANVTWDGVNQSVFIERGNRSILLRIDKNLIEYKIDGNDSYGLSDVPPIIVNERTLVPVRLISNALGVGINWNENSRTVTVNSSEGAAVEEIFDMKITSVSPGQTITGKTTLQAAPPAVLPAGSGASEVRYMVMTPGAGTGFIVAKGTELGGSYEWLPSFRDSGRKILVAALYNKSGQFLAGQAIPIQVNIAPEVKLSGVQDGQVISGTLQISPVVNFSAAYVKYEISNTDNGKTLATSEQDPIGAYSWAPPAEYNGNVTIKVTAYDQKKNAYPGQEVSAVVQVARNLSLTGIKAGQTVDRPVTLNVSRNFDVTETSYFVKDVATGAVQNLHTLSYGGYTWFPGPDERGQKEVYAQVKGSDGTVYTSSPVTVSLSGGAKLMLQGTGPDQVITVANPATLKVSANVALSNIKYIMTNTKTGAQKVLADTSDVKQEVKYTPASGEDGTWKIKATGTYAGGTLTTEEVSVKVYSGTTYGAKPVIEKGQFLNLASQMAVSDWKQSGMSPALQTAQAILETGWGQSVPVDKYNGKFSYNLFGIKGTGSAGTVTSNTWEEYNGVAFRIDANFRAYNNIQESWADHNALLLTRERYEPYRKVMHDSSLGAWALRRCGYATDSQYPMKLMSIIDTYNLEELDKVSL